MTDFRRIVKNDLIRLFTTATHDKRLEQVIQDLDILLPRHLTGPVVLPTEWRFAGGNRRAERQRRSDLHGKERTDFIADEPAAGSGRAAAPLQRRQQNIETRNLFVTGIAAPVDPVAFDRYDRPPVNRVVECEPVADAEPNCFAFRTDRIRCDGRCGLAATQKFQPRQAFTASGQQGQANQSEVKTHRQRGLSKSTVCN